MKIINTIIACSFPLLFVACSVTKNLPEEEVLYTGIKEIQVDNRDNTPAGDAALTEVNAALAYAPNNAVLGSSSLRFPVPFGLWMYNSLVNKRGKLNHWLLRHLATKPKLISNVNPQVRTKVAYNLLREYGYFNAATSYALNYNPKDPRQASVSYRLVMNQPYTYDTISYVRLRHRIDSLVETTNKDRLINEGDNFNVTQLEAERQRISALLRDNGYFYFSPQYIVYQADTINHPGKVALRFAMKSDIPVLALRPWKIGNVSVWLHDNENDQITDSLLYHGLMIHYGNGLRVRPRVLYKSIKFHSGDLYTQTQQIKTQNTLSRLGIFQYSDLQFSPLNAVRRQDTLNLKINTSYDLPWDGELEFNFKARSDDQAGPGAKYSITRRNIFGGGETLGLDLSGSYEWQTGNRVSGNNSAINSWELGTSATLTFPRIIWASIVNENSEYPNSTSLKVYVNQLNRARFFKMLAFGGESSYDFQTSAKSRHSIMPFKLTYTLLQSTTATFDSITKANPALRKSLENQFIPSIGYTYTYDDSYQTTKRNHIWFQTSVRQAGNLLAAGYAIAGNGFNKVDKKLFGNKFAQFLKLSSEIRYDKIIGVDQHLVGRVQAGVAWSYGNSHTTPYSEQFYIGGANSIRAFTIRSIGPGRFVPDLNNKYGYIDQTGDLKFEANLEYRFPIFGDLRGAAFLDSGNIWLLRNDEKRPGGQFKASHFLKDLALGSGFGFRYDLDFIVIRLDLGIALHVPYDTGKSGYYNIPKFKDNLGLHLAVGYPF